MCIGTYRNEFFGATPEMFVYGVCLCEARQMHISKMHVLRQKDHKCFAAISVTNVYMLHKQGGEEIFVLAHKHGKRKISTHCIYSAKQMRHTSHDALSAAFCVRRRKATRAHHSV